MKLIDKFEKYLVQNNLVRKGDKVLLTVSGGKDSMLMLRLFCDLGTAVEVAHCNFNLRGEESDGDEQLVMRYADQLGVPVHVKHFETEKYARENNISIQMAARELRYAWFGQLADTLGCTAIAVAQHKHDHVETVLLNLVRGTGLRGMHGILPQRDNIIRPLLFLDALEIRDIVAELAVPYRDDSSNFSTKYARNKIRLDIIPQFEEIAPEFVQVMEDNVVRFQESYVVLDGFVRSLREELFVRSDEDNRYYISKSELKKKDAALLYLLFEPYQFSRTVMEDVQRALYGEVGRAFYTKNYGLLVDREFVVLEERIEQEMETVVSEDSSTIVWKNQTFRLLRTDDRTIMRDPRMAQLDADRIVFPLTVRAWREGDFFYPLGMNGKKKVSDFFVNQKVNLFDKKQIAIWINGNGDLLWIGGYRVDDRYKITENTQKVLTLVQE